MVILRSQKKSEFAARTFEATMHDAIEYSIGKIAKRCFTVWTVSAFGLVIHHAYIFLHQFSFSLPLRFGLFETHSGFFSACVLCSIFSIFCHYVRVAWALTGFVTIRWLLITNTLKEQTSNETNGKKHHPTRVQYQPILHFPVRSIENKAVVFFLSCLSKTWLIDRHVFLCLCELLLHMVLIVMLWRLHFFVFVQTHISLLCGLPIGFFSSFLRGRCVCVCI